MKYLISLGSFFKIFFSFFIPGLEKLSLWEQL